MRFEMESFYKGNEPTSTMMAFKNLNDFKDWFENLDVDAFASDRFTMYDNITMHCYDTDRKEYIMNDVFYENGKFMYDKDKQTEVINNILEEKVKKIEEPNVDIKDTPKSSKRKELETDFDLYLPVDKEYTK